MERFQSRRGRRQEQREPCVSKNYTIADLLAEIESAFKNWITDMFI